MAKKAEPGFVVFEGVTHNVLTNFGYASFYRIGESTDVLIKFHRTAGSAQRGTWDSPQMRKVWQHVGWAEVQR